MMNEMTPAEQVILLKERLAFEEELRGEFIEQIWTVVGDGNAYDYPAQVIRYTEDMRAEKVELQRRLKLATEALQEIEHKTHFLASKGVGGLGYIAREALAAIRDAGE
jgi:hypothetical protein